LRRNDERQEISNIVGLDFQHVTRNPEQVSRRSFIPLAGIP
jgi:hypothetical protein